MKMMKSCILAVLFTCAFALASCGDEDKVPVQSVTLDKPAETLLIGEILTLETAVLPANATDKTVIWSSSRPDVATVDDGTVTAVAEGECTVTVTTVNGGKTAECVVTVISDEIPVTGVTLMPTAATVAVGISTKLTASVQPADATDKSLKWTSDNTAVADVDSDGNITGVAEGNTTVTVATVDGNFKAECAVKVTFFGEISFRTDDTKTIADQTWSDVVMATRCKKEDFDGGHWGGLDNYEFLADCRQSPGCGDLFSWEAVDKYKDDLCPGDWRVPTKEDFITLDLALGGTGERDQENPALYNKYITVWGAELGGHALKHTLNWPGMFGNYWSQSTYITEQNGDSRGHALVVDSGGWVNVFPDFYKYHGFNVRCVK